jgi:hypothetical protein
LKQELINLLFIKSQIYRFNLKVGLKLMQGYIFGYDLLRNIGVSFQKDRKDFKSTGSCDLSYKMIVKNSGLI